MSKGLGNTQRRLINEMTRNGGTYPPAWHIKHADKLAFQSLVSRGIVDEVSVDHPDKGVVVTYRLVERNLGGPEQDAKVADFIDTVNRAIVTLDMLRQSLEEMVAAARRLN